MATAYPWETNVYFTGSATKVQLLKASIDGTVLTVAVAATIASKTYFARSRIPLGVVSVVAIASTLGAYLPNTSLVTPQSSLIAAVRLVLVFVSALLLARLIPMRTLWNTQLAIMFGVVTLAIVETYGLRRSLKGFSGRLSMTIPPVPPNTVAVGALVLALYFGGKWLAGMGLSGNQKVGLTVAMFALVASGSRGCLIACAAGWLVSVVATRTVPSRVVFIVVGGMVGVVVLLQLLTHGGTSSMFTRGANAGLLTHRSIAWNSVLSGRRTSTSLLLGNGVNNAVVSIPFNGWTATSVVNNGWLLALVQGGVVGVALLLGYLIFAARLCFRTDMQQRAACVAVIAGIVVISFTEAGLLSTAPLGVILMVLIMFVEALGREARSDRGKMSLKATWAR